MTTMMPMQRLRRQKLTSHKREKKEEEEEEKDVGGWVRVREEVKRRRVAMGRAGWRMEVGDRSAAGACSGRRKELTPREAALSRRHQRGTGAGLLPHHLSVSAVYSYKQGIRWATLVRWGARM